MKLYAFFKFEYEFNFDRDIIRKLIDSYFRTCSNDYVAGKLSISHQVYCIQRSLTIEKVLKIASMNCTRYGMTSEQLHLFSTKKKLQLSLE